MPSEIIARVDGNRVCSALHVASGATLVTDPPPDDGGAGATFSPTDLLATALGTCVLSVLRHVADRHGVSLDRVEVRVTTEVQNSPRRIDRISTRVVIPAAEVSDSSIRKRLERAASQCPVHRSLNPNIDAPIDFVYAEGVG